jgi:hypothetical protein
MSPTHIESHSTQHDSDHSNGQSLHDLICARHLLLLDDVLGGRRVPTGTGQQGTAQIELYDLSVLTTASVPRIELPTTETVIGLRCDADRVSIATYSAVYNYDLHELRRPRLRKREGLVNVGVAPEGFSTASVMSNGAGVIPISTRAGLELVVMYVYEPFGTPRVGVTTYQSVHLVFRDVARGIVQAVEIMFFVNIEAG